MTSDATLPSTDPGEMAEGAPKSSGGEHPVPPHEHTQRGFTLLGTSDAGVCEDGVCAVPDASVADIGEDRAEA